MILDGQSGGGGLLVLVDPVRTSGAEAARIGRAAKAAGVRGLLIGSSFDGAAQTHEVARVLRENAPGIPVALFPGSAMQRQPSIAHFFGSAAAVFAITDLRSAKLHSVA